jgi:hypothetical protein
MAEILYKSSSMCQVSEPRDQFARASICKITTCLTEAGIPMLRIKTKIMAIDQIHYISMSYNYIKCSREKYTADLHLKIKRYKCIVSIFKKLSVV